MMIRKNLKRIWTLHRNNNKLSLHQRKRKRRLPIISQLQRNLILKLKVLSLKILKIHLLKHKIKLTNQLFSKLKTLVKSNSSKYSKRLTLKSKWLKATKISIKSILIWQQRCKKCKINCKARCFHRNQLT